MAPFVNALLGTAAVVGVACAFFAARRGDDAFFGLPAVGAGACVTWRDSCCSGWCSSWRGSAPQSFPRRRASWRPWARWSCASPGAPAWPQYDLPPGACEPGAHDRHGVRGGALASRAVAAPVGMAVFAFLLVLGVALPVWKAARGELSCLCDVAASDGEMQAFKAAVRGGARVVDDVAADDGSLARRLRAPWSGGVRAAVFAPGDAGEGAPAPARAFFSTVRRMASGAGRPVFGAHGVRLHHGREEVPRVRRPSTWRCSVASPASRPDGAAVPA